MANPRGNPRRAAAGPDREARRRSLSAAVDDYTKAIDELERSVGGPVTTSTLAERLGVTAPSVSGMLRKLDDLGYLEYLPYHGFTLSEAGRRHGRAVIRRHRLVELLLSELLGMPWDKVHDEAERLEHAISPELCELIERRLGYPRFDPHGDPIPQPDGSMPDRPLSRLAEVVDGTTVRIRRVSDRDPTVLRSLSAAGVALGDELLRLGSDGATVTVRHRGRQISLSSGTVAALFVEPTALDR